MRACRTPRSGGNSRLILGAESPLLSSPSMRAASASRSLSASIKTSWQPVKLAEGLLAARRETGAISVRLRGRVVVPEHWDGKKAPR
jgi:hypothetical protein